MPPEGVEPQTLELYANFKEWLDWNGEKCSDDYEWYYRARVDCDKKLKYQVELNDLGLGHKGLPTSSYYGTR